VTWFFLQITTIRAFGKEDDFSETCFRLNDVFSRAYFCNNAANRCLDRTILCPDYNVALRGTLFHLHLARTQLWSPDFGLDTRVHISSSHPAVIIIIRSLAHRSHMNLSAAVCASKLLRTPAFVCACLRMPATAHQHVCQHCRWLGIRLEFIGNIAVGCSALFAVIYADDPSAAGMVGLSITYALEVTGTLNWFIRYALFSASSLWLRDVPPVSCMHVQARMLLYAWRSCTSCTKAS
jgi:hypothetical protein